MDENIIKINDKVIDLSKEIETLVSESVSDCCAELDDLVGYIRNRLIKPDDLSSIPTEELHRMITDLASILYFAVGKQESLGIKEDISKKLKNEVFSNTKQETSGTVSDKEAAATLASQSEDVVLTIYNKAYKQTKAKIDAGYEVLNVIKKVLTTRVAELELSNSRYIGTNVDGE